ncbi:hypothetical protein ABZY57_11820 [Streptomyces sp. NPDC006450]
MTLAELLVRLGGFGLGLTWSVELDEIPGTSGLPTTACSANFGATTRTP